MSGRVLIRYVDGTHADVSRSKLLSKEMIEKVFSHSGYRVTFKPDSVHIQKGRAKAFIAPLGTVYRKYYYNFTGMRLPPYDRLSVEIVSENPELLDRVLETLDRADNIFHIDDAGYHHRGSMELVDHSRNQPRTLMGWASLPDEDDEITPHPVQPATIHVAVVSSPGPSNHGDNSVYLARTEAGMWRRVRKGEGIPAKLVGSSDIQWLQDRGRYMQWSEQELFD